MLGFAGDTETAGESGGACSETGIPEWLRIGCALVLRATSPRGDMVHWDIYIDLLTRFKKRGLR